MGILRVPTYDKPTVTANALPGGQQSVNYAADAYGGQVGGAVGQAGRAVGDVAKVFQKMEDDDGRLWALQQATELRMAAHQRDLEAREKGPADGKGHSSFMTRAYQEDADARLRNAPNSYGQKYLQQHALSMSDDVSRTAMTYEFDARQRYRVTAFDNELQRQRSWLVDNPGSLAFASDALSLYADELPPAQKEQILPKAKADLAMSAVQGRIAQDPDGVAKMLGGLGGASVARTIVQASQTAGVDASYMLAMIGTESNFDPSAVNKASGASGLGQFMPNTAKQYGLDDPLNAEKNIAATIQFTKDNQAALSRKLGRAPESWELYLAHQQGGGGATALLANPDARAIDVLTPLYKGDAKTARQAVLNNLPENLRNENITAGEFAAAWKEKYAKAEAKYGHLAADAAPAISDPVIAAAWNDLGANQKIWALNQAQQAAKQKQAESRANLAQLTADASAAWLNGLPPSVEPTEGQMLYAHGPEKGAIAWGEYQDTRSLGQTISEYKTMPIKDILEQHEARRPVPGEGYAHKVKLWEAEGNAIEHLVKQREDDPVTTTLQAHPALKNELADLKPEDMPQHYAKVWAAQGEIGIPDHKKALLTKAQADTVVSGWNDASQPLNARLTPLMSILGSTKDPVQQEALLRQLDRAGLPKGIIHIAGPMPNDPRAVQTMLAGADARKMAPQYDVEKKDWQGSYLAAVPPEILKAFTPAFEDSLEEGIRNYYVGLSYAANDTSKNLDAKRMKQAVDAVTGGIIEVDRVGVWNLGDNYKTFAAWPGQTAEEMERIIGLVTDKDLDGMWLADGDGKGGGRLSVDTFQGAATLISRGNGGYSIQVGENPVLGRDFMPVILDLGGMRGRLEEDSKRRALPPGTGTLRMTHEEAVAQKQYVEGGVNAGR